MNFSELLSDLSIHYNALIRKVASDLGLTASQAFNLISIPYDGISMSGLSSKLGLDTSTLTRNIKNMEKLELVIKTKDAYDRRVQKIFLTPSGARAVENIEAMLNDVNQSVLENIDIEAQERLLEILEQLVWELDCIREKK